MSGGFPPPNAGALLTVEFSPIAAPKPSAGGSACAYYVLTDLEYGRYARLALLNGQLNEKDYFRLTAEPKKQTKPPAAD